MKKVILSFSALLILLLNYSATSPGTLSVAEGKQPQLTMDKAGTVRLVYGRSDSIFCMTSTDNGTHFSEPVFVGAVSNMPLGLSRGPQSATSGKYTMVTAISKNGTIHSFLLDDRSGKWLETAKVNDVDSSAVEGLMNLAADEQGNFYAVWLDIRHGKGNNICFASTSDHGRSWSKNRMVYIAPEGNVCPCCKPNIAVDGDNVAIMFRNLVNGYRDLYLMKSTDGGNTFSKPGKLGEGTWKLNGCPMDGGGLTFTENDQVLTVWQREGKIYFDKPGRPEKLIGDGRICSISGSEDPVVAWQDGKQLRVMEVDTGDITGAGEGGFIKTLRTMDKKVLCAWENNGKIEVRKI